MRKQLVSGKKLLLFVDTGDNCRCPLAIGYLTKLLNQKGIDYIDLRHMGVMTPNDLLPTPEVVQLLKEEGVDIRYHRSRPVNDDLIRQADLVLGFTAIHVQTCLRRVPESKSKTFLLKEYVGLAHTGDQIHDPMGSTMEIFKKYFSDIKLSLQRLVEMEFIATPPEPKEVVIAPTVTKSKFGEEEDEIPRRFSAKPEDDSEPQATSKKPKKAAKEEPEEAEEEEAEAPARAGKKAAAKEKAAAKPAAKAKPAKADKADKAATKKAAKAEDEPLKKGATAKPGKKTAKAAADKPKAAAKGTKTAKAKPADKPLKKAASATAKSKKPEPAKKSASKKSK